jgi:hypothetical protein
MDLYLAWRESAGELDALYGRWSGAVTAADRHRAFVAFSRALHDEEGAARRFEDVASYAAWTLST